MTEFFKPPAAKIDDAQIGNLLNNGLQGSEPKHLKDEKSKAAWRLQIIKSPKGQAISKTLNTRLDQNAAFVMTKNEDKTKELQTTVKTFSDKAAKDLKKQYDDLVEKALGEAVGAMKKLGKSS